MWRLRLQFSRDLGYGALIRAAVLFRRRHRLSFHALCPPLWTSSGVTAHRGHGLLLRPHDGTLDCDGQFGVDNCVTSADIVRTSSEIGCVFITKTNTTTQAYSRTQGLPKMTTVKRKKNTNRQTDKQTANSKTPITMEELSAWTFRYFASSPPGRFAPLDVSIPGRLAISLDVSPPVWKFVVCGIVRTLPY